MSTIDASTGTEPTSKRLYRALAERIYGQGESETIPCRCSSIVPGLSPEMESFWPCRYLTGVVVDDDCLTIPLYSAGAVQPKH